jgi:hypothetical protein
MEEIIRYDRMGFIPSRYVETLDDYKQESREKLFFLLKIKDSPEKVLYEKFGKRLKVELYEPPNWLKDDFKEVTLTDTWPGVITTNSELGKITTKYAKNALIIFSPLFPFLLFDVLFGAEGRALDFGEKISIPIITYEENNYSIEEKYTHELIHGVRDQFTSKPGEFYAYKVQDKINNAKKFSALKDGVDYGLIYTMTFGFNTPLIAASCLLSPLLLFTALGIIPITAYSFHRTDKKFEKFIRKCENEKLNPYYLILRSDLKEYKMNKSITEQLKEKNGLRWDIIRLRVGKDF